MIASLTGALGPIYLGGQLLDKVFGGDQDFTYRDVKEVVELARGGAREAVAYQGAGHPMVGRKHTLRLAASHLGAQYDLVEELLAVPGPYDVVAWKRVHCAYAGNGVRATFSLPWRVALDFVTVPGALFAALTLGYFAREVRIGLVGEPMDVAVKSAEDYAAGPPAAGEAWFLEEGQELKVGTAPLAGERLYVRYVPVLSMFREAVSQRRYPAGTMAEPADLVLVEQ